MPKDSPNELNNAPLLKSLQARNPYKVPENYFETLADQIEKKIDKKPAVVKHISISRIVARLAAAASIVLFVGTAGWLYLHRSDTIQEEIYLTPEQISNSVYFDELDLTLLQEEAALSTGSTASDEIENYLLENDITFLYE